MDEITLYAEIRKGNIKAFEQLFGELYPSMCAVARRYTDDRIAAEDIAQEAFIKLWEKKMDYAAIPSLKTFLYVAVKNLSLNYIRDKKNNIDCDRIDIVSKDNFFPDQLIREETYRIISKAIDVLPYQSAKIIKLVLEGKQNQEIAKELQISVATVKTLKYNAIHTLKKKLGNYFYLLFTLLLIK